MPPLPRAEQEACLSQRTELSQMSGVSDLPEQVVGILRSDRWSLDDVIFAVQHNHRG